MKKAIVAMSGGVDSSVAAFLMREAGYEITGATMRHLEGASDPVKDAAKVASQLGISFVSIDMRETFQKEVIQRFIMEYESGRTPNPCIICNRYLKFETLYNAAVKAIRDAVSSVGIDAEEDRPYIVTGHYAIIEYDAGTGRYKLRKAKNRAKDQSYFLYSLTQEQLSRTLFPLGDMSKEDVRALAEKEGFITAHKKDSQDVCFIPDGDYVRFITGYTGKNYPPGDFVDADGNVMGQHKGIINYTIGQRKGLGLALKKPAYVCRLDTAHNKVILGDNEDLFTRELIAADFNWVSIAKPNHEIRAMARIRYRHQEAPAVITPLADGRVKVVFDDPQRAITPGQSVVLYDGDDVLGGGIIL